MAGNFWASSHYEQWIFDKAQLSRMRCEDLKIYTEEEYQQFMIFWANFIQSLAMEGAATHGNSATAQKTRMQVIATAVLYFKRFYLRRSFGDADPFLIACSSIFLATKVEEHGQFSMSKLFQKIPEILKKYPNVVYDISSKNGPTMYEAECIMVEIMDCCLVVYHPYRPLTLFLEDIIGTDNAVQNKEELNAQCWSVVNDTMRTDCALVYAPHIIACASIIVGVQLLNREKDIKEWLPELDIDLDAVMDCVQMIVKMYQIWKSFDDREQVKPLIDKLPPISSTTGQPLKPGQKSY